MSFHKVCSLSSTVRKLTVDPDLTAEFDLDDSSSEEEETVEPASHHVEEDGEVKQRKGKGRRMWGRKFKVRDDIPSSDMHVDGNHNLVVNEE